MRLLQGLGWVLLLLATAFFWRLRATPLREEDTVALLAYPLARELRFALESGEREVKLVSWLAHPRAPTRDPRHAWTWRLEASILDADGRELRRDGWWLASRDADGDTRLDTSPEALTEDRLARVKLDDLPTARTLVVRASHLPEEARTLLVAWRLADRPLAHRLRLLRTDGGAFHADLAAALRLPAWADVPAATQAATAAIEWERLGALSSGGLVPTERLLSDFRHSAWSPDAREATALAPGQAVAWNVVGPAIFWAEWQNLDQQVARTENARLRVVHGDGRVEERELPKLARIGPILIEDSLASVHVALGRGGGLRGIRAWLQRGDAWGDAPTRREGDLLALGPDLRRIELFRTDPGDGGLDFEVPADHDLHLSVRVSAPAELRDGFSPVAAAAGSAAIEARDAAGEVLGAWSLAVPGTISPFERAVGPDDDRAVAAGEPATAWIVPPVGTRSLHVEADRRVDVGLRARPRLPFSPLGAERYPLPEDLAVRPRYTPGEADLSAAVAPGGYEALFGAGRVIALDAQTRLEPDLAPLGELVSRSWSSVRVAGASTLLAEAGAGSFTRLGAKAVATDPTRRLEVDYRVDPERVGASARLLVDGSAVELPLRTATGTLRLPPARSAAVETPGLFLARAGGATRGVRVAALSPDRPLRLPVPAGEGSFSARVYLPPGTSGSLEWRVIAPEVDPGLYAALPRRHDEVPLHPDGSLADGISVPGRWERQRSVLVWIPAPGAAGLELTLRDCARPGWLRLTSTWP